MLKIQRDINTILEKMYERSSKHINLSHYQLNYYPELKLQITP